MSNVKVHTHQIDLRFCGEHGEFGLSTEPDLTTHVVATCLCGWTGTPHRPEMAGALEVQKTEFRQHVMACVAHG